MREEIGVLKPGFLDNIRARMELREVCESPIELDLAAAMACQLRDLSIRYKLMTIPQYVWGRFRIDFAILMDSVPVLFIECDGREFHSSPEQRARDRKKDEAALEAGIRLLRFSGSALYRDADSCAAHVLEHLSQLAGLQEGY